MDDGLQIIDHLFGRLTRECMRENSQCTGSSTRRHCRQKNLRRCRRLRPSTLLVVDDDGSDPEVVRALWLYLIWQRRGVQRCVCARGRRGKKKKEEDSICLVP